ncbi:fimbrial protein [Pseudomonas fluorescens]|uniref:fimbrial protein n=1 Tax=Pseudomonas fluorescens TaxID=294 RepID=UPI001BE5AF28|nr:fimbrial protein [Pseudomonas fluorescens]MBT2372348.1 fimbrial protein [Pseudomonas fluorescens]
MNNLIPAFRKTLVRSMYATLLGGIGLFSSGAQADILNIGITGQIAVTTVCTINGGHPIDVDFGEGLLTTHVDGVRYAKEIPFTMACTGTPSTLALWVQGSGAIFDGAALQTDLPDLGIRFLKSDGSQLSLGDKIDFTDPSAPPALRAAPVKKAGTNPAGRFNGAATLRVDVA